MVHVGQGLGQDVFLELRDDPAQLRINCGTRLFTRRHVGGDGTNLLLHLGCIGCNIKRTRQPRIDIIEDFRPYEVAIVEHLERGRWCNQRRAQDCSLELLLKPNRTIGVAFDLHAAKHLGLLGMQFDAGGIHWHRAGEVRFN
jgi:hypothetical protein